jgi:hypothetical protein
VQTLHKIMTTTGIDAQLLGGEDENLVLILLGDPD